MVTAKSDLHLSTDATGVCVAVAGDLPIRALWRRTIEQVQPEVVITTGTAGGVQADTLLGDVIVARHVQWDCTLKSPDEAWAHTAYTSQEPFEPAEFTVAAKP